MPAWSEACLGLKWLTLRLFHIWPPTWSNVHAKLQCRDISDFQISKSRQKKTHNDFPVSIPFQWSPIFCSTIMQKISLETSRTTELGWSAVCYQPVLEIGNFQFLKVFSALIHLGSWGKSKNVSMPSFRSIHPTICPGEHLLQKVLRHSASPLLFLT